MKVLRKVVFLWVLLGLSLAGGALGQDAPALLDTSEPPAEDAQSQVTAVYGVSGEDFIPAREMAKKSLRPNVRTPSSRPSFDLPDAFYFIGGPIFLLIFLRVLVIFLNGFEEKRREEMRSAANEAHRAATHNHTPNQNRSHRR